MAAAPGPLPANAGAHAASRVPALAATDSGVTSERETSRVSGTLSLRLPGAELAPPPPKAAWGRTNKRIRSGSSAASDSVSSPKSSVATRFVAAATAIADITAAAAPRPLRAGDSSRAVGAPDSKAMVNSIWHTLGNGESFAAAKAALRIRIARTAAVHSRQLGFQAPLSGLRPRIPCAPTGGAGGSAPRTAFSAQARASASAPSSFSPPLLRNPPRRASSSKTRVRQRLRRSHRKFRRH